jgi:hypothetical protein
VENTTTMGCNAKKTTTTTNEFFENLIISLALKFIHNRKKFIVEVGSLPGCDALSLRKYFLPR